MAIHQIYIIIIIIIINYISTQSNTNLFDFSGY
jgi:hypothetical protein